jgi:putative addiction module component (TIGR02574 family)
MSTQLQSLVDAAMLLSESERGELTDRLLDTLQEIPDFHEEWDDEIQRRLEDHRSGKSVPVPHDEAMKFIMDDSDDQAD